MGEVEGSIRVPEKRGQRPRVEETMVVQRQGQQLHAETDGNRRSYHKPHDPDPRIDERKPQRDERKRRCEISRSPAPITAVERERRDQSEVEDGGRRTAL